MKEDSLGLKRGRVLLVPHDACWHDGAQRVMDRLSGVLLDNAVRIEHVGSTAVPGLWAKPIIDLAVAVKSLPRVLDAEEELRKAGIIHRPQNDGPGYLFFVCGDFSADTRTHHIHITEAGDARFSDYVRFRDALMGDAALRQEYESLKRDLSQRYPDDRAAYTARKAAFIRSVLEKEKESRK